MPVLKVGLTGGYASGKSFVAAELEHLGCFLIYADKLGHDVLRPAGEAYAPTVDAFGPSILAPDGTIDRKKLGSLVFASPDLLAKLNGFVHPAVFRLEEQLLDQFALANPDGITVIEAAILIETGRYRAFDRVILTACSAEVQIARAIARDALSRDQVLERLSRQMLLADKKRYADFVIDTEGPKSETLLQVARIFEELRQLQVTAS